MPGVRWVAANYTDWTILTSHGASFAGEPRLDHARLRKSGVLSVFLSKSAPPSSEPTPVPLHVIDFATGSVFEVHAGQGQRVTDEDGDGFHEVVLTGAVGTSPGVAAQSWRWLHQGNVVSIAFHSGDLRKASFELLTSADGITWTQVLTSATDSGTTTASQTFACHGADGAFTIEALVRFDSLPGSWTSAGQIVAMEGDGTGAEDRVFQFRI
jgi:hypothetical protein